jgi:hypothetical protein
MMMMMMMRLYMATSAVGIRKELREFYFSRPIYCREKGGKLYKLNNEMEVH